MILIGSKVEINTQENVTKAVSNLFKHVLWFVTKILWTPTSSSQENWNKWTLLLSGCWKITHHQRFIFSKWKFNSKTIIVATDVQLHIYLRCRLIFRVTLISWKEKGKWASGASFRFWIPCQDNWWDPLFLFFFF